VSALSRREKKACQRTEASDLCVEDYERAGEVGERRASEPVPDCADHDNTSASGHVNVRVREGGTLCWTAIGRRREGSARATVASSLEATGPLTLLQLCLTGREG